MREYPLEQTLEVRRPSAAVFEDTATLESAGSSEQSTPAEGSMRLASAATPPVDDLERHFGGSTRRTSRTSWEPAYIRRAVALDLAAAALAAVTVLIVSRSVEGIDVTRSGWLLGLGGPLLWVAAIALSRGYERRYLGVGTDEFRCMPMAALRVLAVAAVAVALTRPDDDGARMFVLGFVPISLVGSLILRFALRKRLHHVRQSGRAMQRVVVVGRADAVRTVVDDLRIDASHGLLPVAACTPDPAHDGLTGLERHGHVHDTMSLVDDLHADAVAVAHPSELTPHELRRLSWALEERDVELIVSPGIMEVAGPRLSIRPSSSLSLVHVERPSISAGAVVGKMFFDRIAGAALLVMLAPAFAILALAIRLDSKGPVFFRQERIGAGGRSFRMVKFRSMVPDAEQRLDDLRENSDGNDVLFKQHNDPRVTRVGRVLRRYSLDELPQLFNVIRGQMSLVGPRPPLRTEVDVYGADAFRRLRVRPGMTGLWQVSGRSDLSWEDSLRLDLRYVDNWSMMLDLQIIWRTVRAVLWGKGAY